MTRLTLKDEGYPFKKICQGHKWVGRVYKNADGKYVGKIGTNESKPQATERAAFEAVGAVHLGHASAEALHQHNSQVRAKNRAVNARVNHAMEGLRRGDFSAMDKLLDDVLRGEKKP